MDDKHQSNPDLPPMLPLGKILAEMADLLQYAVKNIDKIPPHPKQMNLDAQLEKLQQDISAFDVACASTFSFWAAGFS